MLDIVRSLKDPWRTLDARLLFPRNGDGVVEVVSLDPAAVRSAGNQHFYFRLFDPGRWNCLGQVYLTVRYQGAGFEFCQYSSKDARKSEFENTYNRAEEHYIEPHRSDSGKTDVFLMADPAFGHRMDYNGDIRLKPLKDTILTGFDLRPRFRQAGRFTLKPEVLAFLLEITAACNFDCPYCASAFLGRKKGVMPLENALHIVDQLPSLGNNLYLNLHILGEPMLHPHFQRILDRCAEKGVPVGLFTNGSLFDPHNVETLLDAGPQVVILSCHTDSAEGWQVRRANIGVEEYERRVLLLIDAKIRRKSPTTIQLHYLNTHYTTRYEYPMVHSPDHAIAIVRKWCNWLDQIESKYGVRSPRPDPEAFRSILDQGSASEACVRIAPGIEIVFMFLHNWANQYLGDRQIPSKRGFCHIPFETLAVFWNGDVTICCLDAEGQINIGNAFAQPIQEIWLGEKRREILDHFLRRKLMHPLCQRCLATLSKDTNLRPLRRIYGDLREYYRSAFPPRRFYATVRKYRRFLTDRPTDRLG